ncbi:signal peptide peptidase SppA [Rosenbergiella australiborealis]|uniref:Signal peptide peptidase SppA n=1 Tax=Rosenbergiella australiborealis TaxID=1544696 RepID=A0ABS5T3L5_9GAMM|nr:signal peptide peptidase SppA [Rosenbergiella australiborealis]MBT0726318.1 signal peptide peptidase SppA [Rosenbergiella australiborealis]
MRTAWRIIVRVISSLWRVINFVRECILNLFLLVIILVGIAVWGLVSHDTTTPRTLNTSQALVLNLDGIIVEQPSQDKKISKLIGQEFLGSNSKLRQENPLFDLVKAIRQAKEDKSITGIVLDLHNFAGGDQPSLNYIGQALQEFKSSGKPIYAYGDNYSQAQYYLASYADHLYLSPLGAVDLHGMATNNLYFKTLLDNLKVSSHIFRVGTYKSAVEPFLRDDMSPAARDADTRWITQLWQGYLTTVSANRKITPQQLFPGAEAIIAALQANGGNSAQYAVDAHLVDGLKTHADVEQLLTDKFGWDNQQKSFKQISIYDYTSPSKALDDKPNIAVIVANGAIMDGPASDGNVGGETTAQQIREARLDPEIKAIILRVNSPGGSVTASEQIREELMAVKKAGKPIVVSMGGLAASGGYWISTPADFIIASPTTLTGSIGIFGVINTVENTLGTIGVHTDGVSTSPLADISMTKALPESVTQMMQLTIDNGYHNFVNLVAQSRHMTPEQVNAIAQGHVWTGEDAKQNGLVDALGNFDDAVNKAQSLAHLQKASLKWIQEDPTWVDALLSQMQVSAAARLPDQIKAWLPAPLAEVMTKVQQQPGLLNQQTDPQNRYAWCINCGVIN